MEVDMALCYACGVEVAISSNEIPTFVLCASCNKDDADESPIVAQCPKCLGTGEYHDEEDDFGNEVSWYECTQCSTRFEVGVGE